MKQVSNFNAEDWMYLARQSLILIRNLSDYRRGNPPTEDVAFLNLSLIGELSDAVHELPVNLSHDNNVKEKLIKERIREFIKKNPQFEYYFRNIEK